MKKEQISKENPLLKLAEEISRLTDGMCGVGPGPYGFGVSNDNAAEIGLALRFDPNPNQGDQLFPEGIEAYEITVEAFDKADRRPIEKEECAVLPATDDSATDDPATRRIADAVRELSQKPVRVSLTECMDAFHELAERDMAQAQEPASPGSGMVQQMV